MSKTSQHRTDGASKHSKHSFSGRRHGAHRKLRPATSRVKRRIIAVAVICSVIAGAELDHLVTRDSPISGQSAAVNRAQIEPSPSLSSPAVSNSAVSNSARPRRHRAVRSSPRSGRAVIGTAFGYANPFRAIKNLMPQRIDMGVDFGGSGPIYALGDAVITNAISDSAGWPGGGWITYRLTSGRANGLMVYVAEDVTPTVQVGQVVNSSTVIATMYNGGAGIETGWAQPDGSSAESQLPVAGGISGGGPFPVMVGINFEELLQALGVPPSPFNRYAPPSGLLPAGYPTWPSNR